MNKAQNLRFDLLQLRFDEKTHYYEIIHIMKSPTNWWQSEPDSVRMMIKICLLISLSILFHETMSATELGKNLFIKSTGSLRYFKATRRKNPTIGTQDLITLGLTSQFQEITETIFKLGMSSYTREFWKKI